MPIASRHVSVSGGAKFAGAGRVPCVCAMARRTARLISQLYANHLRERGTEPSQFAMLQMLRELPGTSQVALTRILDIDKTTLSRNLKLLRSKGLVTLERVEGQREEGCFLTATGKEQVQAAQPAWNEAQDELRSAMTAEEWAAMWKGFEIVTRVVHGLQIVPR